MNIQVDSKDRYPGPRPFESGEKDVFFGREQEKGELINLIRLEQILVLFSKSGLGKSSLLNAGVGPELVQHKLWPIRIRFQVKTQKGEYTPLLIVLEKLQDAFDEAYSNLKKNCDQWRKELDALPMEDMALSNSRQEDLDSLKRKQLQSIEIQEEVLTDEQIRVFKQEQKKVFDEEQFDGKARNNLEELLERGLEDLKLVESINGKYKPREITDPFRSPHLQLWEYVKLYKLPGGFTPVFFFDQFEEFFAFDDEGQQELLVQLAEVLYDHPPLRIIEKLSRIDNNSRTAELVNWGRQPVVKAVFAIRDDRLAGMHRIRPLIPLILRNRYELAPLTGKGAHDAITGPAQTEGDFSTPAFSYEPTTLDLILKCLSNVKEEIDSTQLQMVCNYVQSQVKAGSVPSLVIDHQVIPDEQKINEIIDSFYLEGLNSLKNEADILLAGKVLEKHFVIKGQRMGVEELLLLEYLNNRDDLIRQLIEARLIRPESTSRGSTVYELSHDKLIEPVEKARKERAELERHEAALKDEEERQKQRMLEEKAREAKFFMQLELKDKEIALKNERRIRKQSLLVIVLLFMGFALVALFAMKAQSDNINLYRSNINVSANQQYDFGKHYLAYHLWKSIDSIETIAPKKVFAPFSGRDVYFDASKDFVSVLTGDNKLTVFKKTNGSFYNQKRAFQTTLDLSDKYEVGGHFLVLAEGDTMLQVVNLINNNVVLKRMRLTKQLGSSESFVSDKFKLSPDGNFLLAVDSVNQLGMWKLSGNTSSLYLRFPKLTNPKGTVGDNDTLDNVYSFFDNFNFLQNEQQLLVYCSPDNRFLSSLLKQSGIDATYGLLKFDLRKDSLPTSVYKANKGFNYDLSSSGRKLAILESNKNQSLKLLVIDLVDSQSILTVPLPRLRSFRFMRLSWREDKGVFITHFFIGPDAFNLYYVSLEEKDGKIALKTIPGRGRLAFDGTNEELVFKSIAGPGGYYSYSFDPEGKHKHLNIQPHHYSLQQAGEYLLMRDPAKAQPYLFDIALNKQYSFPPYINFKESMSFKFFSSTNGERVTLIIFYPNKIHIAVIKQNGIKLIENDKIPVSSIVFKSKRLVNFDSGFQVDGDFFKVRTTDGNYLAFFVDPAKNQLSYLESNIYPSLSEADKNQYNISTNIFQGLFSVFLK